MTALAKALIQKLGDTKSSLYFDGEENNLTPKDDAKLVARKLNDLAVNLNLTPYDDQGAYIGKLLPISLKAIQPIHMICPGSLVCGTATCKPRCVLLSPLDNPSDSTRTQGFQGLTCGLHGLHIKIYKLQKRRKGFHGSCGIHGLIETLV